MYEQHERAHPDEVARPREGHECDGGHVVHEHLPEVLAPHVEELREGQRPVEAHLHHVVPPRARVQQVARVVVPAVADVPQPRLVPQRDQAEQEDARVVQPPPPGQSVTSQHVQR